MLKKNLLTTSISYKLTYNFFCIKFVYVFGRHHFVKKKKEKKEKKSHLYV